MYSLFVDATNLTSEPLILDVFFLFHLYFHAHRLESDIIDVKILPASLSFISSLTFNLHILFLYSLLRTICLLFSPPLCLPHMHFLSLILPVFGHRGAE